MHELHSSASAKCLGIWSSRLFWMSVWWESWFQCFLVFSTDLVVTSPVLVEHGEREQQKPGGWFFLLSRSCCSWLLPSAEAGACQWWTSRIPLRMWWWGACEFTRWNFVSEFSRIPRGMETPLDVLSRAASLVHADDEKRKSEICSLLCCIHMLYVCAIYWLRCWLYQSLCSTEPEACRKRSSEAFQRSYSSGTKPVCCI